MANRKHYSLDHSETLTITVASQGTDAGAISNLIDNSLRRAPSFELTAKVALQAGAVIGEIIQFYLVKKDESGIVTDNLTIPDVALATADVVQAQPIATLVVDSVAAKTYQETFTVMARPGYSFAVAFLNKTTATTSTTAADHQISIQLSYPEDQG
jgi:hypothetical protein